MKFKDFQNLFCITTMLLVVSMSSFSQPSTFTNPILPGAYPDPSICKVGDDYYIATSSFEYFPGLPILHSKDLVHWEHAGFGIHRKEQFNFDGLASSAGAWAPTIRHNNGTFYLPVTWVDWRMKVGFKNAILTATNPAGPWSDPYIITDTIWGIDPSLFFDDDGKSYFIINHPPVGFSHPGGTSIMLKEIDLQSMKLIGKPSFIGRGAMIDSQYPEGGRMIKKDGYYYLLVAEGGTGVHHAVTISRSKSITGPYENYQGNPILTHRALGYTHPIINVGHADLVETQSGEWWMVALGSRVLGGKLNILGRETFMVPVKWDKGEWPIVSPGHGFIREIERAPKLDAFKANALPNRDEFDNASLSHLWTFIRTPTSNFYSFGKGKINIKLLPEKLTQNASPAFIGQRIRHKHGEISTLLDFKSKKKNEEAGLVFYKSDKAFVKFVVNNGQVRIIQQKDSVETVLFSEERKSTDPIVLRITQHEDKFSFSYSNRDGSWKNALTDFSGGIFSVEESGGFMGTFVGMYGGSLGVPSKNLAAFEYFEYKPVEGF